MYISPNIDINTIKWLSDSDEPFGISKLFLSIYEK